MSAQHTVDAGIEMSIRIGQRVRHQDYKGQRVTGTVQGIAVEGRELMALIALDRPIIIPASEGCREIQIHTQRVPAHEVAPFDEREELIAEMLEALRGVVRVADRATDEFDAARAAIAKATGCGA
ncbi:hypothetical protein J7E62_09415 [Variovorax paradoxus]|nr:hypothetical protein [Variovorax paradoxus]